MPQFNLQSAGGFLGRIAGQRQILVGTSTLSTQKC